MAEKLPKTEAPMPVDEAVKMLKQFPPRSSISRSKSSIRLGIDPKQADQLVRGSIVLPHGIGKSKQVVVFAKGDKAEEAKAAGADEVGAEDLAKKIKDGWTDFDACIAAPDMMGLVGPLGKVLGPARPDAFAPCRHRHAGHRQDGERIQGRQGGVPQRPTGIVHAVVGKLSFDEKKLAENIQAFIDHILHMKPHG